MKLDITQQGVGLVEVMVALLLLAVAILGYSALQGQAIKATNESFERSQSLVIMRNIAEKIHANPFAVATYAAEINDINSTTAPTKQCGLDGTAVTTASFCAATELAEAESYKIKIDLQNYDFQIQMHPCPNTGGNGTDAVDNIMFSYCLISAWGNTTATIGEDSDTDCLTARVVNEEDVVEQVGGNYHSTATCMMMEI